MFNSAVIYYFDGSPRYELTHAMVNYCRLNDKISFKKIGDCQEEFFKLFPEHKVPCFYEEEDDFKLTEVIAISYYILSLGQDNQKENIMVGLKNKDKATVLKWMSFFNQEVMGAATAVYYALEKPTSEEQKEIIRKNYERLDTVLIPQIEAQINGKSKYLSHLKHITLCDLFGVLVFKMMFKAYLGDEWRAKHPNIYNWYKDVMSSPYMADLRDDGKLLKKDASFVKL